VWILSSPRWRRRLFPLVVLMAIGVPLVFLGIHLSSPGDPGNANGPEVPGYVQPKSVRFTPANQRAVHKVLREFILTAVDRQDVGRSWDIAAPSMRAGFTHKQWNRGDLPVVPYPAANRGLGRWSFVQYSYAKTVGLEVYLFPKPGSGWSAMTADVELVKGHDGNWRVDYWMPKRFHGPPSVAATTKAKAAPKKHVRPVKAVPKHKAAGKRRAAPPDLVATPKTSRIWWIVPIALLGLIVVAPIGIGIGVWYRNRRAARQYVRT
jgi:hypothetical protein